MDARTPVEVTPDLKMAEVSTGDSVEFSLKGVITADGNGGVTLTLANGRELYLVAGDVASIGLVEPDYSAGSVYLSADGNQYRREPKGWRAFDGNDYADDFPMRPLRLLAPVA